MKCNSLGLAVLLAAFAASALAQTHTTGTLKCSKPDVSQNIEVGDHAGHVLIIEKGSCAWSAPFEMAGLKTTASTFAEDVDVTDAKAQARGYLIISMDNGDKAYIRYQGPGTTSKEGVLTAEGTWSYTGGTGKLKGLKGKGTYKLSGTPDGASESQVDGEYSLPEPSTTAKKK
jgi:hypothetical protein